MSFLAPVPSLWCLWTSKAILLSVRSRSWGRAAVVGSLKSAVGLLRMGRRFPEVFGSPVSCLSAGGRAAPPPADEVIEAFADTLEFGAGGTLFIRKLPQEIVGVVLRTFRTTQDRGECDPEFIRHAMLIEDAWNNGKILEVLELM